MSNMTLLKPTNVLPNFEAIFPEVTSLLNSCVERTVILNEIPQDNKKSLSDEREKNSSYIGWRGAWRKPCLHFRLWLRRSNKMVEIRKNDPWQKIKTLSAGQTRSRG